MGWAPLLQPVMLNFLPDAGGVSAPPVRRSCRNKFGMTLRSSFGMTLRIVKLVPIRVIRNSISYVSYISYGTIF